MYNPNNKFEFNSYYDTERINGGLNTILNNHHTNYNADSNNKVCYSSFLGEKEEEGYQDLLNSLLKDIEFIDMYTEFQDKEKIIYDFNALNDEKKVEILIKCFFILKSQKDQVIEEYWKIKSDVEEKQRLSLNSQIEKYKNEAYMYKCERDELKIQINNLKTKKDGREKDIEKLTTKCEKYKEKVCELEKGIVRFEVDKKEMENKFVSQFYEINLKMEKMLKENEFNFAKIQEMEEENDNWQRRTEDFKMKCEILSTQVKDLNERNITLQRMSKKNMNSNNFNSGVNTNMEGGVALGEIIMTELSTEVKQIERPSQYTYSMKLNVKDLKGITMINKNPSTNLLNFKPREEEKGSAMLKKEILINNKNHDPNRISCFIEDDNIELCGSNNDVEEEELELELEKEYLSDLEGKKVENKIDTIHNYESHGSNNSYESGSVSNTESNFVTEMDSEMNSNNMNSENSHGDFQTDRYDTLRQFHPKKISDGDNYGSNNIKY